MSIACGTLDAAEDIVKVRETFRELAEDEQPATEPAFQLAGQSAGAEARANRVIAAWLKRQGGRAPETLPPLNIHSFISPESRQASICEEATSIPI